VALRSAGTNAPRTTASRLVPVYYAAISIALLCVLPFKPAPDWDRIAYVAVAMSFEIDDPAELHASVYREFKAAADAHTYRALTEGRDRLAPGYRKAVSTDPKAFAQQLPFYRIKILYVLAIYLLAKLGMGFFFAASFVPAVCVALSLWVVYAIARPRVETVYMYVLPLLCAAFGIVYIGRMATPDGLALLAILLAGYFFLRGHWALLVVLPIAVGVRPDLILLGVLFSAYLLFSRDYRRAFTVASLAACVTVYVAIETLWGSHGWATLIHHSFIERLTHPATAKIELTASKYLAVLFGDPKGGTVFTVYLSLAIMAAYRVVRERLQSNTERKAAALLAISFVYVAVHVALFPALLNRFFAGPYILTACIFAWSLSRPAPRSV
jgi:hypothetical protein